MKDGKVIDDWVDPEEIRQLAEKLMTPSKGRTQASDDPAYGDDFVGFVEPTPVQTKSPVAEVVPTEPAPVPEKVIPVVEPKPEPVPEKPEAVAGHVQVNPFEKRAAGRGESKPEVTSPFRTAAPKETPARKPEPPVKPVDSKESSLEAFVDWVKNEIPLEAVLICGRGGLVLFDELRQAKLISVARLLAGAAHRKGASPMPAMVVKTGPKQVMQVIPFRKNMDDCFAALMLPRPLADVGVRAFEKALSKAL